MKKNALTTPKDKLLNLAVGAGIPLGTTASGAAGGCTGICGSCGGTCLGGFALAATILYVFQLCAGSLALQQRIF